MKQSKIHSFKWQVFVILLFACGSRLNAQFSISGPAEIQPGVQTYYYVSDPQNYGIYNANFKTNSSHTTKIQPALGVCYLTADFEEQNCFVVLSCTVTSPSYSQQQVITKSVKILPYIY